MGNILIVIGLSIVTSIWVIWVLDWLGHKLVKPKQEKPSYISDMESELGVAKAEVDASIAKLRDELSQVIAKELPKAVKTGKHSLTIEMYASKPSFIIGEVGIQVTPNVLSVLQYHNRDNKWAKEKLIDPSLDTYIDIVSFYGGNTMYMYRQYASIHIMLK